MRLLFILKSREGNWGYASGSSGLANSVRFVVDMLTSHGIEAKAVEVQDNNCIDREVTAYRPTHVIVEAFWVVPEKFDVLKALHPRVRWIVRDHSETPFLANEGIAFGWTAAYLARGVEVMCNAPRAVGDMQVVASACAHPETLVTYGPNYYPTPSGGEINAKPMPSDVIDIGCFGAIRPLKNHMVQAIAAMAFADAAGLSLRFHVNATRVEGNGSPVLKNLREVFAASRHELVEHGWQEHADFLRLMATMDICMQVSFTETFNIVAADAMASSVPVVASSEFPWLGDYAFADPTSSKGIAALLMEIWAESDVARSYRLHRQRRDMVNYNRRSECVWLERFA